MFAEAAATWPDVGLVAYHDAVAEMETVRGSIRGDGVHVDVGPLAELAREDLLDEVLAGARLLDRP